jgi:hypothetical protein
LLKGNKGNNLYSEQLTVSSQQSVICKTFAPLRLCVKQNKQAAFPVTCNCPQGEVTRNLLKGNKGNTFFNSFHPVPFCSAEQIVYAIDKLSCR